jgi:uncharacterized protein with HEPN domain
MHPDEQVKAYLWDIRDAARDVAKFVRGVKFEEFEKKKVLRYAIERQLRLIGDVADHIPLKFREKHPEINWIKLSEFHHMLEHQYGETLAKRMWIAATESLPEIMGHLEPLLSEKK